MKITDDMWQEIDDEMNKMFQNSDIIMHLFEDDMKEQMKMEMVMDIIEMKMGKITLTEKEKTIQQLVYAVKYSLLITKFEELEQYETCAEIKNEIGTAMMNTYNMSRDKINQLFFIMGIHSKNTYKMMKELIDDGKEPRKNDN